jgi:inner membrane protein
MFRHGHYGVALLASAPATYLLGPAVGLPFSLVVVATSMVPDWDTSTTRVRHRGPTHTLAFAVAVAVVFGSLASVGWLAVRAVALAATNASALTVGAFVAAGGFLGVASHLIADALNPGRDTNVLRPFWPASRRVVRLGIARVDSPAWNWGLLAAGVAAQLLAVSLVGGLG